jgi:MFS family permease
MPHLTKSSTWTALRSPAFRNLWFASLLSGTCVAAHDTAATWLMNMLTASPLLISLLSTVAALPFFLLTLPAGAVADVVDRKKLLCVINVWQAVVAALLAILGFLRLLNPPLILAGVFLIGIGFAFNAPAWAAIVPKVVPDEDLPSAATLSGLQLNISALLGPALGGLILPLEGPNILFATNALGFLVVLLVVLNWKPRKIVSKLPLENFFESFATAIRYASHAPGIQVVLFRNVLFTLFIAVVPALLPVVGLKELHLSPSNLGLLFTSIGAGSIAAAVVVLPWARARCPSNVLTILANVLLSGVFILMAFVRQPQLFFAVAALAGICWTVAASELWVAGQRAMPGWARGRMNATIIMIGQGAIALGGVVWGSSAVFFGPTYTLLAAALLLLVTLPLDMRWSISITSTLNFDPAPIMSFSHKLIHTLRPHDGPVSITIEYQVDRSRGRELMNILRQVRLIHLRNGAYSWQLYEDLGRQNTFRVEMAVPSWNEYLLAQERLAKSDQEIIRMAENLHLGPVPPETRFFLCVNRELHTHRHSKETEGATSVGPMPEILAAEG